MAKTKGAREPPTKVAKCAGSKKVAEADGEASEASTTASSSGSFRMDTPLLIGGDITIGQLMKDEEISFKEAVGVAMRLREETKQFLAADVAEDGAPEPKPAKTKKVKSAAVPSVPAEAEEGECDVRGIGSAGSKAKSKRKATVSGAEAVASEGKATANEVSAPSKVEDTTNKAMPASKVKDAANKVMPTSKKDTANKATSKVKDTACKEEVTSKAKHPCKLASPHVALVATEKPAALEDGESVEPSPQLKAFWDKYKVSKKSDAKGDAVSDTVPDHDEDMSPRLLRLRATTDLGESLPVDSNPLPPVAVRRGWSCGTLHVADQQLSKQRGVDTAETVVMENASQILAGQLDIICIMHMLGGSVSQTGSSSSSAVECAKLQKMIEQMQLYQATLVKQLHASGQDVPAEPKAEVSDMGPPRVEVPAPAAPEPEDEDMDGRSMCTDDAGGDDAEASGGSEGEATEPHDELEDALEDELAALEPPPVAARSMGKPDKTKIVEEVKARRAVGDSQPSSERIFATQSVPSSPASVPTDPKATARATEPPQEEIINSRTHKREYMVLVPLSVILDRQELLKRWVQTGGNVAATEASIQASRTSRSKARTVKRLVPVKDMTEPPYRFSKPQC
ncbi:unnamed protein product [Symbiodinium sp. CCMP2456]|nr:unnamed protein product [Symbiodinium sp. CCMP2456]